MRTVVDRSAGGVLAPADFRDALATTWSAPAALQPLGHRVALDAPAGLIPARVAPVPAYDGASLRFAPAVGTAQAAEPFDWTLPSAPLPVAAPPDDEPTSPAPAAEPSRPSLLDRVLRRTPSVPAAAAPAPRGTARGGEPSSASRPGQVAKSVEEDEPARVVAAVPVVDSAAPSPEPVRPLDLPLDAVQERSGPAPAVESTTPAGPLRFTPAPTVVPVDLGRAASIPSADGAPVRRPVPAAAPLDPAQERSGPETGPESDPVAGPRRSAAAPSADGEPVDPDDASGRGADQDTDLVEPALERSGPEMGPESGPMTGPLHSQAADDESGRRAVVPAADDDLELRPATRLAALPAPDVVRAHVAPAPSEEQRTLVGRRPLGVELLDAVRTAAAPRPVAALAPAALPDPVASSRPAGAAGPAAARPSPFTPPARGGSARRPVPTGEDRWPAPSAAAAPGPPTVSDVWPASATAEPDRWPGGSAAPVQADGDAPGVEPARDLPAGVPDWWPASGSWSVRDVDPFQVTATPDGTDAEEPDPSPAAPASLAFDDAPVLRQRVRPTSDPATGAPVSRRVPWPTDELPVLRQVRRPGSAAQADPPRAAHLELPHEVADLVTTGLTDLDLGVAAPRPDAPAPRDAAPAQQVGPAPQAGGPDADELARELRHTLLVERERAGALADEW